MSRKRVFQSKAIFAVWVLLFVAALVIAACAQLTMKPSDLSNYNYRILDTCRIKLYLDSFGRGWLQDADKDMWFQVPQVSGVEPDYCRTSNSLALVYALYGAAVFDATLPSQNPWIENREVSQSGQGFGGFSRSSAVGNAAQCNDNLALAVGANWFCVYDRMLHRWVNAPAPADTSTGDMRFNIQLTSSGALVQSWNGPAYSYALGSGMWTK